MRLHRIALHFCVLRNLNDMLILVPFIHTIYTNVYLQYICHFFYYSIMIICEKIFPYRPYTRRYLQFTQK